MNQEPMNPGKINIVAGMANKPAPNLPGELNSIEEHLAVLSENIRMLEDRLAPVLVDHQIPQVKACQERESAFPIQNQTALIFEGVKAGCERVESILDRLAL